MLLFLERSGPMAGRVTDPYSLSEIAKRLKILRRALQKTQATMASMAGVTPQAWGNYEQGIRRIEIDAVTRLRASTGVTSEWIYYNNGGQLPGDLETKIELAQRELTRGRKVG